MNKVLVSFICLVAPCLIAGEFKSNIFTVINVGNSYLNDGNSYSASTQFVDQDNKKIERTAVPLNQQYWHIDFAYEFNNYPIGVATTRSFDFNHRAGWLYNPKQGTSGEDYATSSASITLVNKSYLLTPKQHKGDSPQFDESFLHNFYKPYVNEGQTGDFQANDIIADYQYVQYLRINLVVKWSSYNYKKQFDPNFGLKLIEGLKLTESDLQSIEDVYIQLVSRGEVPQDPIDIIGMPVEGCTVEEISQCDQVLINILTQLQSKFTQRRSLDDSGELDWVYRYTDINNIGATFTNAQGQQQLIIAKESERLSAQTYATWLSKIEEIRYQMTETTRLLDYVQDYIDGPGYPPVEYTELERSLSNNLTMYDWFLSDCQLSIYASTEEISECENNLALYSQYIEEIDADWVFN